MFGVRQIVQLGLVQMYERFVFGHKAGVHLELADFNALRSAHPFQRVSSVEQSDAKVTANRNV